MLTLLKQLGPELALRPAATQQAIAQAQHALSWTFPSQYIEFLLVSNGATGMLVSGDHIDLWSVETLVQLNRECEFAEYLPDVIAFGSDGGGEAFVFRRSSAHIALVPFIGKTPDTIFDIAPTLAEFFKRARPSAWD